MNKTKQKNNLKKQNLKHEQTGCSFRELIGEETAKELYKIVEKNPNEK